MSDFNYRQTDRVSRQQAAERLIDLAYALTVGRPLEVKLDAERMRVPIADQVVFERESKSNNNRFALGLELSWSTPEAEPSGACSP